MQALTINVIEEKHQKSVKLETLQITVENQLQLKLLINLSQMLSEMNSLTPVSISLELKLVKEPFQLNASNLMVVIN